MNEHEQNQPSDHQSHFGSNKPSDSINEKSQSSFSPSSHDKTNDPQNLDPQTQSVSFSAISWNAPLPHPSVMRDFADIDPTFPDRIVSMTEQEALRRHDLEKEHLRLVGVDADKMRAERSRGQWMGFILCLVLVLIGAIAAFSGHEAVASVIFSTTVIAVVTVFVVGRSKREKSVEND